MKTLLVDARYFSSIIRHTRKKLKINHRDMAQMLALARDEYMDCEHGKRLFPESALMRMMHFALLGLSIRHSLNHPPRGRKSAGGH